MINNEANNSNQPKEVKSNNENSILNNLANNNDIKNNIQNKDDEIDDSDNLKYKGFLPNNTDPFILQRLDSNSSPIAAQYKFSIDQPNVSKQRLHEYLNNDLLNALDVSPSISKINSGIPENLQNLNDIGDNNPNNLYGFSLYPQSQSNNQNVGNDINNNYNFQNPKVNNDNYNYQNNFNYNYQINNNAYKIIITKKNHKIMEKISLITEKRINRKIKNFSKLEKLTGDAVNAIICIFLLEINAIVAVWQKNYRNHLIL